MPFSDFLRRPADFIACKDMRQPGYPKVFNEVVQRSGKIETSFSLSLGGFPSGSVK
jgi:hypothetical protein